MSEPTYATAVIKGLPCKAWPVEQPSRTPSADYLAHVVEAAMARFTHPLFWERLSLIEVCDPEADDAPASFASEGAASYYYPGDKRIVMSGWFWDLGDLMHEVGHALADICNIGPNADSFGRSRWDLYLQLRPNMPLSTGEQWANDFRDTFAYGAEPVMGLRDLFNGCAAGRGL